MTETLLEFPCRFPLKIMGEQHDEFVDTISALVREHVIDLLDEDILLRTSKNGRFYGLTITINAQSKEQLDNIYRALSAHPMVSMVL